MPLSRIPRLPGFSFTEVHKWFSTMQEKGLLFHPDDDPADIICIKSGAKLFSPLENDQLRCLLDAMFAHHGNDVYEAAYPVFRATLPAR